MPESRLNFLLSIFVTSVKASNKNLCWSPAGGRRRLINFDGSFDRLTDSLTAHTREGGPAIHSKRVPAKNNHMY